MYYICFASRTDTNVVPATRTMVFVSESRSQFNVNLALAREKYGKNHLLECVRIRHDGQFHLEQVSLE